MPCSFSCILPPACSPQLSNDDVGADRKSGHRGRRDKDEQLAQPYRGNRGGPQLTDQENCYNALRPLKEAADRDWQCQSHHGPANLTDTVGHGAVS